MVQSCRSHGDGEQGDVWGSSPTPGTDRAPQAQDWDGVLPVLTHLALDMAVSHRESHPLHLGVHPCPGSL